MEESHEEEDLRSGPHGRDGSELAHKTAASHSGSSGHVFHGEDCGGEGAQQRACQNLGKPDVRISENVRQLQHGAAEAQTDQSRRTVVPVAAYGETHKLTAAPYGGRAGRGAVHVEHDGDGRTGKRRAHGHAHDDGDDRSCDKRLRLGGRDHDTAQKAHEGTDGRTGEFSDDTSREEGCDRRDENVQLRPARNASTAFRSRQPCEQSSQWTSSLHAGKTAAGAPEQDQRRRAQAPGGGSSDCRSHTLHGQRSHPIQKGYFQFASQRPEDDAHDQRGEKTKDHGFEGVEDVLFGSLSVHWLHSPVCGEKI